MISGVKSSSLHLFAEAQLKGHPDKHILQDGTRTLGQPASQVLPRTPHVLSKSSVSGTLQLTGTHWAPSLEAALRLGSRLPPAITSVWGTTERGTLTL